MDFSRPDLLKIIELNGYVSNVGGHYFKGNVGHRYNQHYSLEECNELVAQEKLTRLKTWDAVLYFVPWVGIPEIYGGRVGIIRRARELGATFKPKYIPDYQI